MTKRILVIDDTEQKRELLREFLTLRGFEVRTAQDGKSGYQASQENAPDLILLDFHLPDLEGAEVCRMIRESSKTRDVPIIIVTASTKQSLEKVWGFRSGADDYISAPVDFKELLERVYAILR